jgi:hypothetical protein
MQEYADRGDELEEYSFLDFFLNTYEGLPLKEEKAQVEPRAGRPKSTRIAYRKGSSRQKTCRIIRAAGHETAPKFIGTWFPHNDDEATNELYCASALALLFPWRELQDIRSTCTTFRGKFDNFIKKTGAQNKRILANIQYYYVRR